MKKMVVVFLIGLLSSCAGPERPEVPTATVKDIMDSMVDPSADVLWNSVATIVSVSGTEERSPKTDDEWKLVRRSAIVLIEATTLLRMPGRLVARPGERSENPGIELGPPEIESLIARDRRRWGELAHGLHDAGLEALAAIDRKMPEALYAAGEKIDRACETCHRTYWYPNEPALPPAGPATDVVLPPPVQTLDSKGRSLGANRGR